MAAALSRETVVAATRRLIRDEGLDAVSLRRIAGTLGVTAPALYAHVADKRDLLRAVAEAELDALSERFAAVEATDPLDRTRGYCRAYIDHALAEPALFKTMFLFPPRLDRGQPADDELPAATRAFTLPAEAVRDAVQEGGRPTRDPLVATMTTWAAMHGAAEVLLMGFELDDTFREQLIDAAVEMAISAVTGST